MPVVRCDRCTWVISKDGECAPYCPDNGAH